MKTPWFSFVTWTLDSQTRDDLTADIILFKAFLKHFNVKII